MKNRALRIVQPGVFEIVNLALPDPKDNEVLVRVEYAAICNQNDVKIFNGLYGDLISYPCEPGYYGHEGSGVVVKTGGGVDGLSVGDKVAMMLDGGPPLYCEYVTRESDCLVKLDPNTSLKEAAVLELFGCACHCTAKLTEIRKKTIAINGLGPAGIAIFQVLRNSNPMKIIGMDIDKSRLRFAESQGLKHVYNPDESTETLSDNPPDIVIDTTGNPHAIGDSIQLAGEEVMLFGFTEETLEIAMPLIFEKELTIRTSRRQTVEDLAAAVRLHEERAIDPHSMISVIMSYQEYDRAVSIIDSREAIKILLKW